MESYFAALELLVLNLISYNSYLALELYLRLIVVAGHITAYGIRQPQSARCLHEFVHLWTN